MTTAADIEAALRGVLDPELGADVVELGMVRGIDLDDGTATIHLALTIAACPLRDQIEGDVTRKVSALPGIDRVAGARGGHVAGGAVRPHGGGPPQGPRPGRADHGEPAHPGRRRRQRQGRGGQVVAEP